MENINFLNSVKESQLKKVEGTESSSANTKRILEKSNR
jgi:hypothetical protein